MWIGSFGPISTQPNLSAQVNLPAADVAAELEAALLEGALVAAGADDDAAEDDAAELEAALLELLAGAVVGATDEALDDAGAEDADEEAGAFVATGAGVGVGDAQAVAMTAIASNNVKPMRTRAFIVLLLLKDRANDRCPHGQAGMSSRSFPRVRQTEAPSGWSTFNSSRRTLVEANITSLH